MKNFSQLLLLLTIIAGLSQPASAKYTITVVDQDKKPVNDAVISFVALPQDTLKSPELAVMDQLAQQFSPKVLIIEENQQVIFPNSDNTRHHVYSFSAAKPFEIQLYSGTPQTPITFDKQGVVALGCNIHDDMVAYIYVQGQERTGLTNKKGIASFANPPQQLATIWHFDAKQTNKKNRYKLTQIDEYSWQAEIELVQRAPKKSNTFRARYK